VIGVKGLLSTEFVRNYVAIYELSDELRPDLKRIVWLPDQNRAFVRSDDATGYYCLTKYAGTWVCSCPSNVFSPGPRIVPCKHITQVQDLRIGMEWPTDMDVIFGTRR